jgi:hypothetical protein
VKNLLNQYHQQLVQLQNKIFNNIENKNNNDNVIQEENNINEVRINNNIDNNNYSNQNNDKSLTLNSL